MLRPLRTMSRSMEKGRGMTREEAIKLIGGMKSDLSDFYDDNDLTALDMAISALSADVRENAHGEWILEYSKNYEGMVDIVCSECGYVGIEKYALGYDLEDASENEIKYMKAYVNKFDMNYCTCCGAKMDKGASE